MKKIYLHMGFHKTATTSFQMTCKQNKDLLLEQDFNYPLFNSAQMAIWKDIENHGCLFGSLFSNTPEKHIVNILTQVKDIDTLHVDYLATLESVLNGKTNIIFSGEDISTFPEEFLYKLKNFLSKYNFEVVPLLVIRSPYAHSCSFRQELLRLGLYRKGDYLLDYKLGMHSTYFFNRENEVEKILKVFPNTRCFSFKDICKHSHGPTGFLLEQMGVDYTRFEFVNVNEGASNTIIRVQEKLNIREERFKYGKLNPNFISIIDLDSKSFTQKYLLTEAEYALVKDQCEASNAFFREQLGEEYTDTEIKFSQEDDVVKLCTGLIDRLENKFARQLAEREREREREQKGAECNALQRCVDKAKSCLQVYYYLTYLRYRIGAEITFGAPRKRYRAKKKEIKPFLAMLCKRGR